MGVQRESLTFAARTCQMGDPSQERPPPRRGRRRRPPRAGWLRSLCRTRPGEPAGVRRRTQAMSGCLFRRRRGSAAPLTGRSGVAAKARLHQAREDGHDLAELALAVENLRLQAELSQRVLGAGSLEQGERVLPAKRAQRNSGGERCVFRGRSGQNDPGRGRERAPRAAASCTGSMRALGCTCWRCSATPAVRERPEP